MLTIGDFSKLSRVPVKTLRFYDETGLFKAMSVDRSTGYRYYSASQLSRLYRILALKDLGFSLEQIAQVLDDGLSLEQLRGMFRLKQAEIQQRVAQEQERLTRIEVRLSQLEMEETMPTYDVIVKHVEPQLVASIRDVVPRYQDVGRLIGELYAYLQQQGTGGGLTAAVWHDEGYKASDVDAEVVIFLKDRVPATERVQVYELPAATMASVIHRGSYATLNQAYDALVRWIETNGYKITGPNRELYLYNVVPVRQDDESYVTEIQFPVEKG
ncbi:MAG: MerR family transcriptional regulator [Ktedonobacteraceae bacterium]|nr:MerR family transcriptional regulator [Ktedonobacteraceae bacterium]